MTGRKYNAWTLSATQLIVTPKSVVLTPTPPPNLCDHMLSHTQPETADIDDHATKQHLLQGNCVTILLVRKLNPVT